MTGPSISVVPREAGTGAAALATSGIARFEAFASEGLWIGYATTTPGVWSGWHHHGETDTYLYLVSGTIELEFGAGGSERASAGPGDFAHVPAGVVHREGTPPGAPAEAVVVRIGSGPTVVNVDGPGG